MSAAGPPAVKLDFLKSAELIEENANQFCAETFCTKVKGKTTNVVFAGVHGHAAASMLLSALREASRGSAADKLHVSGLLQEGKLDAAFLQWFKRLKTFVEFTPTPFSLHLPPACRARSGLKNHLRDTYELDLEPASDESATAMIVNIAVKTPALKLKATPFKLCGKHSFKNLAGKKVKMDFMEAVGATVRQGSFSGFTATEVTLESETSLALVIILPRSSEQYNTLCEDPNYVLSACGAGGGDASWRMSAQTVILPVVRSLQVLDDTVFEFEPELCKKLFKATTEDGNASFGIKVQSSLTLMLDVSNDTTKTKNKSPEWKIESPFILALTWKRAQSRTLLAMAAIADPSTLA